VFGLEHDFPSAMTEYDARHIAPKPGFEARWIGNRLLGFVP